MATRGRAVLTPKQVRREERKRLRKLIIILGQKGTGKSSLARYLASVYPGPLIVLDPMRNWESVGLGEYPSEAYKSPKALEAWFDIDAQPGMKPRWSRVPTGGALFIGDDFDVNMIPKNGAPTNWRFLWMTNRHLEVDGIIVTHRPQGVPLEAFAAADELIGYKMEERNAQKYLGDTSFGDYAAKLAGLRAGQAIRVVKDPEPGIPRYTTIDYFAALPKPEIINARLLQRAHAERAAKAYQGR